MSCDQVRERLDAFQDGEIEGADAAAIVLHLGSCSECSEFAEQRETLRLRLRNAVHNAETPPELGYKVHLAIARDSDRRKWVPALMAVAAALVISAGAFYFWPAHEGDKPAVAFQYSDKIAPVMDVGLRQHVHCGVLREYPKDAPTLLELAHAEGSNAGLINAVESHAPEGLHVVMAHQCSLEGRTYTHVIARSADHLMSLLITKRETGDELSKDLKAVASELDTSIFAAGARKDSRNYAIASFETSAYLVYLISDLDPDQNLAAFRAMTPQVRAAML